MKAGAVPAGPCVGTADSWHLCGQQAGVAEQDWLRGSPGGPAPSEPDCLFFCRQSPSWSRG